MRNISLMLPTVYIFPLMLALALLLLACVRSGTAATGPRVLGVLLTAGPCSTATSPAGDQPCWLHFVQWWWCSTGPHLIIGCPSCLLGFLCAVGLELQHLVLVLRLLLTEAGANNGRMIGIQILLTILLTLLDV